MQNQQQDYFKVQAAGFVAYCDCLIARKLHDSFQAFFMSLTGTAAHIQALVSCMFQNEALRIFFQPDQATVINMLNSTSVSRSRKIETAVHRVMASPIMLLNHHVSSDMVNQAVVFAVDEATVKERAFLRLNADTTVPLKESWMDWLWDEILQPEKLYSFGNKEVRESYLIQWPKEIDFQNQVLEAIRYGYLT